MAISTDTHAPSATRRPEKRRDPPHVVRLFRAFKRRHGLAHIILIVTGLAFVVPTLWAVITSFKTQGELFASPWSLPGRISFSNYQEVWERANASQLTFNSLVVAGASTLLIMVVTLLAGYAIARSPTKIAKASFIVLVAGLFIPLDLVMLPMFLQLRFFGLIDSRLGLILPYVAGGVPLGVLIMTQAVRTLPSELLEAARVDGASHVQTLTRIVTPLVIPSLLAVATISFISAWNEFTLSLIVIRDPSLFTVPRGTVAFTGQFVQEHHLSMTMVVIGALPVLLVFFALQRYFIKGIAEGSIK